MQDGLRQRGMDTLVALEDARSVFAALQRGAAATDSERVEAAYRALEAAHPSMAVWDLRYTSAVADALDDARSRERHAAVAR